MLFLYRRFYYLAIVVMVLLATGYWYGPLYIVGKIAMCLLVVATIVDIILLYSGRHIEATRNMVERFSNGDDNDITIHVTSTYRFAVDVAIIDEIPFIFQRRDVLFKMHIQPNSDQNLIYQLCPKKRGDYGFGLIRIFARSPLGLIERRYSCGQPQTVKVYPSYQMLSQYELMAMSNNLTEMGIKRIRRVGHNTEFEQIKDYVRGDEYRTINWRATARRGKLMVNVYQDEKSQQVFCMIDKGRLMQQTFEGMTMLDYAINASLVLSYVSIHKYDKAGLLTFNSQFDTFIGADRQHGQMAKIMEALYREHTDFGESDYSALLAHVNKNINRRSLLILFTSFSGMNSMKRQLPYLVQLNKKHRLLVVFFRDNEIDNFIHTPAEKAEEIYQHVIAEKEIHEQKLIASNLQKMGIQSLLTHPQNLSIDVLNKYLEIRKM